MVDAEAAAERVQADPTAAAARAEGILARPGLDAEARTVAQWVLGPGQPRDRPPGAVPAVVRAGDRRGHPCRPSRAGGDRADGARAHPGQPRRLRPGSRRDPPGQARPARARPGAAGPAGGADPAATRRPGVRSRALRPGARRRVRRRRPGAGGPGALEPGRPRGVRRQRGPGCPAALPGAGQRHRPGPAAARPRAPRTTWASWRAGAATSRPGWPGSTAPGRCTTTSGSPLPT